MARSASYTQCIALPGSQGYKYKEHLSGFRGTGEDLI